MCTTFLAVAKQSQLNNPDKYTEQIIQEFGKKAPGDYAANGKKITRLKKSSSGEVNKVFHSQHDQVFNKFDCMQCANCCKTISPIITQHDMDRLARHLGQPVGQFIQQYLEMDEDGDFVFQQTPCPFLAADNACTVYDKRPDACREYPHTNRSKMKPILDLTLKNSLVCPAVWKMMQSITI